MLPGKARILTCPHCGSKKEVMSLLSGNTLDARYWSDLKIEAPMMPQVSFIQKCAECGKYFLMSRLEEKYGENFSSELGNLSYEETKEALQELLYDSCSLNEQFGLIMEYIHSFNDKYLRKEKIDIPETEQKLFNRYVNQIIHFEGAWGDSPNSQLLKAELFRESGQFDKSLSIIEDCPTDDDFLNRIAERMKCECLKKNTFVFEIQIG
jgi:DNA-directed RNA polymerase subunit RPC12/RpoP